MINRTITKAYLIRHRKHQQEYDDEKERYEYMDENKGSLTSPQITGMPHGSGTSNPVSREAIELVDLKEYIDELERLIHEEYIHIEKYVRELDEPYQKQVIRLRYLSNMEWEDVLFNMFGDRRNFDNNYESYQRRMFAHHRKAIDNLKELSEQ